MARRTGDSWNDDVHRITGRRDSSTRRRTKRRSAEVHSEARRRLDAHTYLSVPERLEHLAMTCVPAAGLDAGTLTVRLKQLVR